MENVALAHANSSTRYGRGKRRFDARSKEGRWGERSHHMSLDSEKPEEEEEEEEEEEK